MYQSSKHSRSGETCPQKLRRRRGTQGNKLRAPFFPTEHALGYGDWEIWCRKDHSDSLCGPSYETHNIRAECARFFPHQLGGGMNALTKEIARSIGMEPPTESCRKQFEYFAGK